MNLQPTLFTDFYKTDHRRQYPEGTQFCYSNFTPRVSRIPGVKEVVVFGIQAFIQEHLINGFNRNFFQRPAAEVLGKYKRRMDNSLGKGAIKMDHLEDLHKLGYLPVTIKALPEGTLCPLKTPVLTICNTAMVFYWVPNFLETLLSCELWHPMTSATIAHQYRMLLDEYAKLTSETPEFVDWQGHDFSMRGQVGVGAAAASGAGHLLSFTGSDTIPAIDFLEQYYGADCEKELIAGSVPATEHAVMCMGGMETELETFDRLISKVYPNGIVSIVSDTWDFWHVLTKTLPELKSKILAREGKVVIRPDSGDPVKIICGDGIDASPKGRGAVELLWGVFGGTTNRKGYKVLDPHIGLIYGDSITLERAEAICRGLKEKGFASTNVVFGIGSYTYQYVTRDTFGFAMKATYGIINDQPAELFKAPATDDGTKNSARGLLRVKDDLTLRESQTPYQETLGALKIVFHNGIQQNIQTLAQIRKTLKNGRN
jgi:nicotinamide phosphoribosyltransferase